MSKEIPLYNKSNQITSYTIVDDEDYDFLMQWRWRNANGYAIRGERNGGRKARYKTYYIHRIVMDCPEDKIIDHISGNTLDNRKENLRICVICENGRNLRKTTNIRSSKFKGVSYVKKANKWSSSIVLNYQQYWLGQYKTELEAAKVYNIYARKLHGEFASLNEIDEENIKIYYSSYASKYKGVYKTRQGTWTARIWYKHKMISLGVYDNEDDAARAYNATAYKARGKSAVLNPVDNWENFSITKTKSYKPECRFKEIIELKQAN